MNKDIMKFQRNEITEHYVYLNMSRGQKGHNKKVLEGIAKDELSHYNTFKKITGVEIAPDRLKVLWYSIIGRIFGITFAAKLMENGEGNASRSYSGVQRGYRQMIPILKDEERHEKALLAMVEEEKLGYMSSMVLGLNDAIVELTGALAGFTFALQNTRVIGAAGFITGIAAALSMASAEYLSQKSEKDGNDPVRAAFYTGLLYIMVVAVLVAPYFILTNCYAAFGLTIAGVIAVIVLFSFFVSVVQDSSFKGIFIEMTVICFGVSLVAFLIGLAARKVLNIQI
jgi:VIT1/CCC1 family predicted Fe2+/Mn2+ transporter